MGHLSAHTVHLPAHWRELFSGLQYINHWQKKKEQEEKQTGSKRAEALFSAVQVNDLIFKQCKNKVKPGQCLFVLNVKSAGYWRVDETVSVKHSFTPNIASLISILFSYMLQLCLHNRAAVRKVLQWIYTNSICCRILSWFNNSFVFLLSCFSVCSVVFLLSSDDALIFKHLLWGGNIRGG